MNQDIFTSMFQEEQDFQAIRKPEEMSSNKKWGYAIAIVGLLAILAMIFHRPWF